MERRRIDHGIDKPAFSIRVPLRAELPRLIALLDGDTKVRPHTRPFRISKAEIIVVTPGVLSFETRPGLALSTTRFGT